MSRAEDFILSFDGDQKDIMLYFHQLLTNEFNLLDKMRYNIPFYYGRSWICYLSPTKKGNVEFAFVRGNELSNDQALLSSKGRKQVFSIEFNKVSDIPQSTINEVINEAVLLDEVKPYESKRKPKND